MADYKQLPTMKWDDLLREAQNRPMFNDEQRFHRDAQGNLLGGGWYSSDLVPGALMNANAGDGGIHSLTLGDDYAPDDFTGYVSRGADGNAAVDYRKTEDTPWGALALLAAPFAVSGLQGLMGSGAGAGAGAATSGASGAVGSGAAGAGAAAGSYAIPTAAELSAAGFGTGGMGLTGAGGIGAASSVAGAGAGGAAYGAAAGGGMLGGLMDTVGGALTSKAGSAIVGGLVSGLASKNAPKSTTATSTMQMDPRMDPYVYGQNGVLSRIMQNMNTPQSPGMQQFGQGMDSYLGSYGRGAFDNNMRAADALRDTQIGAPTASAASMQAAQVNAPGQNNINLSPAFNQMIYGDSAQNPYLQGALQKGVNQASAGFQNLMTDATKGFQDALSGIRGGAIVNGAMGSSRQGIAEGKAIDSFNTQMGRAASQFGQNMTDTILGAQAGAFENGQNRALSAMQGLNQNQYGTAFQNAGFQQQANQTNAGFQQQTNLANLQSQLQTNNLNSDNQRAGIGLSSGLLGQAAGYGQNQDAYAGQKLAQNAGLLSGFTGLNQTSSQTQPLYQNTAGNILGGALAGASLWKAFQ